MVRQDGQTDGPTGTAAQDSKLGNHWNVSKLGLYSGSSRIRIYKLFFSVYNGALSSVWPTGLADGSGRSDRQGTDGLGMIWERGLTWRVM